MIRINICVCKSTKCEHLEIPEGGSLLEAKCAILKCHAGPMFPTKRMEGCRVSNKCKFKNIHLINSWLQDGGHMCKHNRGRECVESWKND